MPKQPNILFIMSDQQQYATAGPAAGGWSPNLERLAREGIWFRRGYTVTTPCAPARASIATAVYPHAHHVLNNCHVPYAVSREIRDGVPTWGPLMSAAGYRMRYAGKAHLGWERGAVEYGFDSEEREFDKAAYQRDHRIRTEQQGGVPKPSAGSGPRPGTWGFHDAAGVYWLHYGVEDVPPEATTTAMQAEAGLQQLRALADESSNQPWCLWMNFTGPHNPYIVPREYAERFDWGDVPVPPSFYTDATASTQSAPKPAYVRRARETWFREIDEEHTRKSIAHYRAYSALIDNYVGSVLDFLDESGQAENTVVVYTSDHGDMMGAHGLWFKDIWPYEETHRMPYIMRWPKGFEAGQVCDDYVRTLDLGPTFLDLAGAEPLKGAHGISLLPLLAGQPDAADRPEHRELFMQDHGNIFYFMNRTICDGRYKFVFNGFDYDELYDLQEDPHEMHNLAENPHCTDVRERLQDRLWDWMLQLEDPYAGRQYAANVILGRSTPPPNRRDPSPRSQL